MIDNKQYIKAINIKLVDGTTAEIINFDIKEKFKKKSAINRKLRKQLLKNKVCCKKVNFNKALGKRPFENLRLKFSYFKKLFINLSPKSLLFELNIYKNREQRIRQAFRAYIMDIKYAFKEIIRNVNILDMILSKLLEKLFLNYILVNGNIVVIIDKLGFSNHIVLLNTNFDIYNDIVRVISQDNQNTSEVGIMDFLSLTRLTCKNECITDIFNDLTEKNEVYTFNGMYLYINSSNLMMELKDTDDNFDYNLKIDT